MTLHTYWDWNRWFIGLMVRLGPSYGVGRNVCLYLGPWAVEVRRTWSPA